MGERLDPELWKIGFETVAVLIGVLIVSGAVVASIYFWKNPEGATKESNRFFRSQSAIRLLTVLVVVCAATILSLFHSLNEGAIAIFSGITGYVLGGLPSIGEPMGSVSIDIHSGRKITESRGCRELEMAVFDF